MDTRTITHADHTDTETLFGEVWAVTACDCELVTKSIEQTGVDMYLEKAIIDGILCWRGTPDGEWNKFSAVDLTKMLTDQNARIAELEAQNKRLVEALESITSRVSVRIDDPRIHLFDDARALLAELSK